MVQLLGSGLIVAAALIALASAMLYGLGFRWRRSPEGRHLFSYQLVIGLVLVAWTARLASTGQLHPHPHTVVWDYARLAAFVLVDWVLGWRLLIIARSWPTEKRRRREQEDDDDPA